MKSYNNTLALEFPYPSSKKLASSTSALLRPYRMFFQGEKKIGKINYIFFNPKINKNYVIGSLCYTPGERLLFFPAINERQILWNSAINKDLPKGDFDHITLDSNFKTSHITTIVNGKKEKKWMPCFNLLNLEKNIYLWFGLSIQNLDALEEMPETINWNITGTEEEMDKEAKTILDSHQHAIFNLLELPNPKISLSKNSFIHLDVYIYRYSDSFFMKWMSLLMISLETNFPNWFHYSKRFNKSIAPSGSPFLEKELPLKNTFPIRVHYAQVEGFKGWVVFSVSEHEGKLKEKVVTLTPSG